MVVDKAKQSRLLWSLGKKKKQERQLEKESKKLNNQQKKQNEQKKKQSGGGQKRGSANRGTKQKGGGSAAKSNGGGNAFGGGLGNRGTTVGSFSGGTSKSGTGSGFNAKSGGISIKPSAAEAFSNKLNTVSGKNEKSGKNSLDEIYGRILDKRYREYLAEQKQLREAEKPKYRNNADYVKGVSAENVKKAKAELGNVLDSFEDGKLPSHENVSQVDLDNALKNIDNFHALGVGDYGFDEEASENLQHTVKA